MSIFVGIFHGSICLFLKVLCSCAGFENGMFSRLFTVFPGSCE